MRRLSIIVCILATLFAVVGTGTASAGSVGPVDNCYGATVRAPKLVTNNSNGFKWGAVQLCQDGSGFFAVYINYNLEATQQGPMPNGQFANAWIYRYHNGVYFGRMSCDNTEGNVHVTPGQIACYTPHSGVGSGVSFRAAAFGYVWNGVEWIHVASGWSDTVIA